MADTLTARSSLLLLVASISLSFTLSGCIADEPEQRHAIFPTRPVPVGVDEMKVCSLLSDQQQSSLELRSARPGTTTVQGAPSPSCVYLGRTGIDYNVQVIPLSAEMAASLPGAEILQVNGFGAVRTIPADPLGPTPQCDVAVDVARDRTIRVQTFTTPNRPLLGDAELCRRATEAASMVMTTVTADAPR